MSQPLARQSRNWQFTHAAAAMGAFWERARSSEARRIRKVRQMFVERTRSVVAEASTSPVASTSLRRSS
ncbi:MAG: hypothetical protein QG573_1820 [Acidobacteriota bacterium]|nr:hypothetical protein [Acidobacteriota bacterium]